MPTPYYATIVVSATTGSTVTCTYTDGTVYRANEVSGKWTFKVKKQGSYTIRGVLGSRVATSTVNVQERKTYNVTLTYVTYITITIQGSGKYGRDDEVLATAGGHSDAGTYTVVSGAAFELSVWAGNSTTTGKIYVDNKLVASTDATHSSAKYTIYPTKNTTISLSTHKSGSYGRYGVIRVL